MEGVGRCAVASREARVRASSSSLRRVSAACACRQMSTTGRNGGHPPRRPILPVRGVRTRRVRLRRRPLYPRGWAGAVRAVCSFGTHRGSRPEGEQGRSSGPPARPSPTSPAPASTHLWGTPCMSEPPTDITRTDTAAQHSTTRRADVRLPPRSVAPTTRLLVVIC